MTRGFAIDSRTEDYLVASNPDAGLRTQPGNEVQLEMFSSMTYKLLILLVLTGSLCDGQTTTEAPACEPDSTSSACVPGLTPNVVSVPQMTTHSLSVPPPSAASGTETATTPSESALTRPESVALPTSRVGVALPRSEFELFVEDAAGRPLPVYGRQLFSEVPTTFAPMDRGPVPASYVLGPGDQLLIRVWGKIDLDVNVTVDRNGQIYLPSVGTLSIAGLRYEQIEGYLRSAISNLYKGFELNVTMGQLRSIQIFVLGSARQPGVYTVSSLSSLVNALFASGGPSATGSMRHIQLRRGGQQVTEFDMYDLLRNGDKSKDAQLLPGDVIFISPVGPRIAITGSVNEPGIYELNGETTISFALKYAGGITNLAETDRVLLERIEDHRRRRVDDFPLDAAGLQRVLHDGDILEVFPISPRFDNAVTLRGNVAIPGRFPWHEGLRVSDLISSRDSLITRDFWHHQNRLAGNTQTEITTELSGYGNQPNLSESGAHAGITGNLPVSSSQSNSLPENAHIDMMTDLSQNSAEINWEYAAIERLDENDLSTRLIAFNLGKAVDNPASPDDQLLKPGDVITIFSRNDLPLPQDKHAAFVRVSGEVNAPGVYRIEPGETLRGVVERAGGLTPHSYLYAAQLTRVSTRLAEEEELSASISQMQRELVSRYANASSVSSANVPEQQSQLGAQQAVISQLSSVHPTGRIVLEMNPRASTLAGIPEFPLEDGDSFYIPPRLNTVQVSGAVYNENAFGYQASKRLSAYLKNAGGPTRQADKKRIFLIRADGIVVSRQSHGLLWSDDFDSMSLLPGDAIIVPTKLKSPSNFAQELPYLTQILSQAALTGAVVSTSY